MKPPREAGGGGYRSPLPRLKPRLLPGLRTLTPAPALNRARRLPRAFR